ncbi:hypothetical protein CTI12_AA536370 [Artemisia annua]|uniref:Uncharacterized protein n=1 Tax=Artemisia annua TaxID=35608 RepID=A0A2U1L3F8_ARTAN|nr:hypothetical protein CTI12_AA536370 [Artemisia annua]
MTGKTPPPNLPKQPIDKAYSITSIKAYIPTPLDLEKLNYNFLSNLLKRFCKTYYVHHHLEAPSSTSTGTAPIDPYHDTNDSLVVMWMSSTISPKLVDMVIDDSTTAHEVWKRLTDIFMIISMLVLFNLTTEKLPAFEEVRSMILLEESDMLQQSNGNSSFQNTSSSPTILVATNTSNVKASSTKNSGIEQCRNFQ